MLLRGAHGAASLGYLAMPPSIEPHDSNYGWSCVVYFMSYLSHENNTHRVVF